MATTIFYTIQDANGSQSVVSIPVVIDAAHDGAAFAFAVEFGWDLINPLVNGQLVNAGITIEVDIADFTNAAAATIADVQEKAEFVFRAVGGFLKRISLPTFVETFFTGAGAGSEVDVTQSAVTAFIAGITDGFDDAVVAGTPLLPSTDHAEDIETFVKGYQSWGKTRS